MIDQPSAGGHLTSFHYYVFGVLFEEELDLFQAMLPRDDAAPVALLQSPPRISNMSH